MRILVHADDYGVSQGPNERILECHDHGHLNSLSILANGKGFDAAMDEYKKRDDLRLAVHLNLVERESILPPSEVSALINERGQFKYSFVTLWLTYLLSAPKRRRTLREQVKQELIAQIDKVQQSAGPEYEIQVDGHTHAHMVPFVFDVIVEIAKEKSISYVRIPREPFHLSIPDSKRMGITWAVNIVKHTLLNTLSWIHARKLKRLGVQHCEYFIGVLYVGFMTAEIARVALASIRNRLDEDAVVEVLFHPGGTTDEEEAQIWNNYKKDKGFYLSPWRAIEAEAMRSPALGDVLKEVQGDL